MCQYIKSPNLLQLARLTKFMQEKGLKLKVALDWQLESIKTLVIYKYILCTVGAWLTESDRKIREKSVSFVYIVYNTFSGPHLPKTSFLTIFCKKNFGSNRSKVGISQRRRARGKLRSLSVVSYLLELKCFKSVWSLSVKILNNYTLFISRASSSWC